MTIKTEINGLPFEIELADGLNLEFSQGKIKVSDYFYRVGPVLQHSWNPNQQPATNGTIQHHDAQRSLSGKFPK